MTQTFTVGDASRHWIDWIDRAFSFSARGMVPPSVLNSAPYRLFAQFQRLTSDVIASLAAPSSPETPSSRAFQSAVRGIQKGFPPASLFAPEIWNFLSSEFPNPKIQTASISPSTHSRHICAGIAALRIPDDKQEYDQTAFGLDFTLFLANLVSSGHQMAALALGGFLPLQPHDFEPIAPPSRLQIFHKDLLDRLNSGDQEGLSEKTRHWIIASEAFFQLCIWHPTHFLPELFQTEIQRVIGAFRQTGRPLAPDFVAIASGLEALTLFSHTGFPTERIQFLCELGEAIVESDPLTAAKVLSLITPITSRFRMRAKETRERALREIRHPAHILETVVEPGGSEPRVRATPGSAQWARLAASGGPVEFAQALCAILQSPEWFDPPRYFIQIRKSGKWMNFERRVLLYGMGHSHELHEDILVGFPEDANPAVVNAFLNAARSAAMASLGGPDRPIEYRDSDSFLYYGHDEPGLANLHEALRDVEEMPAEANILICGEPGVGKTQLAKLIHNRTMDPKSEFTTFSFANGLSPELTASMLFGQNKGAFTDATERLGYFESVSGPRPGTVFLDEIGEAPQNIQPQVLRILSERRAARLGSIKEFVVNCRLIAATNRDISEMLSNRTFRFDLFARFDILIEIPPLRSTPGQIIPVANRYLEGTHITLSEDAKRLLTGLMWHTNYRGLEKMIKNAAAKAKSRRLNIIDAAFLNGIAQRMPEVAALQPVAQPGKVLIPAASGSYINQSNPFVPASPSAPTDPRPPEASPEAHNLLSQPEFTNGADTVSAAAHSPEVATIPEAPHPLPEPSFGVPDNAVQVTPEALHPPPPRTKGKPKSPKATPSLQTGYLRHTDIVRDFQNFSVEERDECFSSVILEFRRLVETLYNSLRPNSRCLVMAKNKRVTINDFLRTGTLWGPKQQEAIVRDFKNCIGSPQLHTPKLTPELIEQFERAFDTVYRLKKMPIQNDPAFPNRNSPEPTEIKPPRFASEPPFAPPNLSLNSDLIQVFQKLPAQEREERFGAVILEFQQLVERLYKCLHPNTSHLVMTTNRRLAVIVFLRNGTLWAQKHQASIVDDFKNCLGSRELHTPELTLELIDEFDRAFEIVYRLKRISKTS